MVHTANRKNIYRCEFLGESAPLVLEILRMKAVQSGSLSRWHREISLSKTTGWRAGSMSKQRIGFVCNFGHAIVPENYTAIFQLAGARKTKPVKTGKQRSPMHRLPKIVLMLILLMAVLSPFMQLDSWDNFPVATGDIELQIISVLFTAGMFFV